MKKLLALLVAAGLSATIGCTGAATTAPKGTGSKDTGSKATEAPKATEKPKETKKD